MPQRAEMAVATRVFGRCRARSRERRRDAGLGFHHVGEWSGVWYIRDKHRFLADSSAPAVLDLRIYLLAFQRRLRLVQEFRHFTRVLVQVRWAQPQALSCQTMHTCRRIGCV